MSDHEELIKALEANAELNIEVSGLRTEKAQDLKKFVTISKELKAKDLEIAALKKEISALKSSAPARSAVPEVAAAKPKSTSSAPATTLTAKPKSPAIPKAVPSVPKKTALVIEEVEEDEEDELPEIPRPDESVRQALAEFGELVPWTIVLRQSHPGSLGAMRKKQKDKLYYLIEMYLGDKLGDLVEHCYALNKNKKELCIPSGLNDDFYKFLNDEIEAGSLGTPIPEKSSPKKTTKRPVSVNTGLSREIANKTYSSPEGGEELDVAQATYEKNSKATSSLPKKSIEEFLVDRQKEVLSSLPVPVSPNKQANKALKEKKPVSEISASSLDQTGRKVLAVLQKKFGGILVDPLELKSTIEKIVSGNGQMTDSAIEKEFEKVYAKEIASNLSINKRKTDEPASDLPSAKKPKGDDGAEQEATRYNSLIRELLPSFNKADQKKRVQVKRQVKNWLKEKVPDFENVCSLVTTNGSSSNHQTYCVPQYLQSDFLVWAKDLLKELDLLK